jgi:hypothetical protein
MTTLRGSVKGEDECGTENKTHVASEIKNKAFSPPAYQMVRYLFCLMSGDIKETNRREFSITALCLLRQTNFRDLTK